VTGINLGRLPMEHPNAICSTVLTSCDLAEDINQAYYLIKSCFDVIENNMLSDDDNLTHICFLLRTYEEKMELFLPALQESLTIALNLVKPKEVTEGFILNEVCQTDTVG
jgi:hypothetical protein